MRVDVTSSHDSATTTDRSILMLYEGQRL